MGLVEETVYGALSYCHIYDIWRSTEMGTLYWDLVVSFTRYWKRFHREPLFTILLLFYLLCIYWNWQQGQLCNLKYPKVTSMILTMNNSVSTVILHVTILVIQAPLPTVSHECIYCNWKPKISEWSIFEIKKFSI